MFKIKVENPSDFVVERAARVFGPSSIKEIEVTEMQYREIKANIYLTVTKIDAGNKAKKVKPESAAATETAAENECDVCGFVAKTPSGLQSHQRAKHEKKTEGGE